MVFICGEKKGDQFCIYIKNSVHQFVCFLWSGFSHFDFSFSPWAVKTLEVSAGSVLTSVLPEIPFISVLLSELKQLFYNICYRFQLHLCIISHPLLLSGFTGPITNLIYFVTDSRSVGHPLLPHALRIISKNHPKEISSNRASSANNKTMTTINNWILRSWHIKQA